MARIAYILAAVVTLVVLLTAFKVGSEETLKPPGDTIEEFHDLASDGKIEETKAFVAKDVLKSFENGGYRHYGSYGGYITEHKQKIKDITALSETVKGNTATVQAQIIYLNGRNEMDEYHLIKEDGKWKIAE